jgi:hypothetical protein
MEGAGFEVERQESQIGSQSHAMVFLPTESRFPETR